ncbi:hypothetical protein PPO43_02055 [Saprospira sp. CCB-QB6]|uniref:hypothetical protein n=1 Tax=Saprospira sp. CCB-QB6 TaxID=3023936 RepID=UPI002349DFA0|nr:hypothetical protein [Saprospira sp. CCB-QB6]WCL81881.1 hypothetical protein PPO43_02055 [Saprospira sp. CCB-QB6]
MLIFLLGPLLNKFLNSSIFFVNLAQVQIAVDRARSARIGLGMDRGAAQPQTQVFEQSEKTAGPSE